jgi:DNA-binding response OmpR family regulator
MPGSGGMVLLVGAQHEDWVQLSRIFENSGWGLQRVRACRDAIRFLDGNTVAAVISAYELPDGSWKDLLSHGPAPIVYSQAADEALWAEVLNLGGADVLAMPFAAREVLWAVEMAAGDRCQAGAVVVSEGCTVS